MKKKIKLFYSLIVFVFLTISQIFAQTDNSLLSQNQFLVIDKNSDSLYIKNLNDTLIYAQAGSGMSDEKYYNLDIDDNGYVDFQFKLYSTICISSGCFSANYVNYISLYSWDNSTFAILDSVLKIEYKFHYGPGYTWDTVYRSMAFKYKLLDTIYTNTLFTDAYTHLTDYGYYTWSHSHCSPLLNEWISGVNYIGIKKTINGEDFYGWIEVEVTGYSTIKFKSFALKNTKLSINDVSLISFSTYPNPANNVLTIKIPNIDNKYSFTIYNTDGRALINQNLYNLKTEIDISLLSRGVYIIRLFDGKNEKMKKFVKL